jgi:hypothetical protein
VAWRENVALSNVAWRMSGQWLISQLQWLMAAVNGVLKAMASMA